jgi:magnesium chelatase subunit D
MTDGRTNVPLHSGDAWQDAIDIASQIKSASLVIDTENSSERLGRSRALSEALNGAYIELESREFNSDALIALQSLPVGSQTRN